jgi:hypothetical protein
MSSGAPELTPCPLTFPYEVSYIRRRCRNTRRLAVFQRLSTSASERSPEAEAPVAFSVTAGGRRTISHSFDVREFEGACFWSLVYDDKFAGARQFLDALEIASLEDASSGGTFT